MTAQTAVPGTLLTPAPARSEWSSTEMGRFLEHIETTHGTSFASYDDAWAWSVEHLEEFWGEVWNWFDVINHAPYDTVLEERVMPGASWFPGARINYAEHIFRALEQHRDRVMVVSRSQTNGSHELTGAELLDLVARLQQGLRRQGIGPGDRVAAHLPNIPETLALYLATTSLGAVWCVVPPEMGPQSVVDRLGQMEPSVLFVIDGYTYGKRDLSRTDDVARIRSLMADDLPVVLVPYLDAEAPVPEGATSWADFTAEAGEIHVEPVAFEHPLTVLFSSGTTGKPKAIVHSHGGILLEHLKAHGLHFSMTEHDRAFWFTTTGWMVWTMGMSSLLFGATVILMDGDPNYPSLDGEWSQFAVMAETGATYMGTGAAYLSACAHAGVRPGERWDLSALREIQCSGSPLAADVAEWMVEAINPNLLVASTSGGTDICAAFLGGSPLTPVWAGEMSCRPLGVAVEAWDPHGKPLVGEPGELVCSEPMPSMPVFFWGDENNERYRGSYFGAYEGVWRHGDWLVQTERGSWVITGRSDATLNRGGVRLGTAEFYAVLDALPQVNDTMVLHFEDGGGMGRLVLLVEADESVAKGSDGSGEEELRGLIKTTLRSELSPRHVPDLIVFVPSIPRNPTGKRLEIPLKRVIQGSVQGEVMDVSVVVRPEDLDVTVDLVQEAMQGR